MTDWPLQTRFTVRGRKLVCAVCGAEIPRTAQPLACPVCPTRSGTLLHTSEHRLTELLYLAMEYGQARGANLRMSRSSAEWIEKQIAEMRRGE